MHQKIHVNTIQFENVMAAVTSTPETDTEEERQKGNIRHQVIGEGHIGTLRREGSRMVPGNGTGFYIQLCRPGTPISYK